jgi:predicted transposase/invertase (TIGR01784 family)
MPVKNEYLRPTNDIVFKKIFSSPKNNLDCLIEFLNATLQLKDPIKEVRILDPHNLPEEPFGRLSILDVKAQDERKNKFNVEIQVVKYPDLVARLLYYWANLFTQDLKASELYETLTPTFSINILDFIQFPERAEKFHSIYKLREAETGDFLTNLMELHFIELRAQHHLLPLFQARGCSTLMRSKGFLEGGHSGSCIRLDPPAALPAQRRPPPAP